jgi:hypothetical protein
MDAKRIGLERLPCEAVIVITDGTRRALDSASICKRQIVTPKDIRERTQTILPRIETIFGNALLIERDRLDARDALCDIVDKDVCLLDRERRINFAVNVMCSPN